MCELKKSLKERLTEGGGQVELLAAVVNLCIFCGEPVNILSSMEYNWSSQANMAGFLQPIGLNYSSQEGCHGNMNQGENQLDWNVFFLQMLSLLLFTLVKPGGPPREPLFHDLPCGTWKQMVFFFFFLNVCHNVCGPVISRRKRFEVGRMFIKLREGSRYQIR